MKFNHVYLTIKLSATVCFLRMAESWHRRACYMYMITCVSNLYSLAKPFDNFYIRFFFLICTIFQWDILLESSKLNQFFVLEIQTFWQHTELTTTINFGVLVVDKIQKDSRENSFLRLFFAIFLITKKKKKYNLRIN